MNVAHIVKDVPEGSQVARVNSLVEKAFGKGFAGNWQIREAFDHRYMIQKDSLDSVAKETVFSQKFLRLIGGTRIRIAGLFEPPGGDGSTIVVPPKYLPQARTYATLYKSAFGKEVTVKLAPR